MYGRAENVREILKTTMNSIRVRVKADSMTAFGYACEKGHLETVKVFMEFKAPKGQAVGTDRMPPICIAAAYGHYDLLKYFVEELKIRISSKDKFK
jgi:ankyrin repeat protein